jgi:hypothetical protein
VVLSNDKRRARIAVLRHILRSIDYEGRDLDAIGPPDDRITLDPDGFLSTHPGT